MATGIQVRDMRSEVSADLLEEIYREILEPSFGPKELDTLDTFLGGLAEDEAWGLCALDGDKPVGCIMGYPFPRARALLIGYVSVRPGLRGGGIGDVLMDAAQQRWYAKPGVALVLAEIEDPRRHPPAGDIDPARRAMFYARRGAQVVVGPYFQPKLEGDGKKRVYDLFLTVISGTNDAISPQNSVPAEMIADFMLDYFRDSGEGSDWPRADDDEGTRLLSWYRDRESVSLQPIREYAQIDIPRISG